MNRRLFWGLCLTLFILLPVAGEINGAGKKDEESDGVVLRATTPQSPEAVSDDPLTPVLNFRAIRDSLPDSMVIEDFVIAPGITQGTAGTYSLTACAGEAIVGNLTSPLYNLTQGFPIELYESYSCCDKSGDANDDGSVNVGDAVYLIGYVFKGGSPPPCLEEGDANCDETVNVGDAVYLINYVFKGGPAPCGGCG